jgi:hypothetical protein
MKLYSQIRVGFLIAAAVGLLAAADVMRINIVQLTQLIKSAVKLKNQDKDVAQYLHAVKLSERLEDEKLDEFVQMGIGPRTIEALKQLQVASASLKEPPPPPAVTEAPKAALPQRPPPDSIQQKKIIDAAREYALGYDSQLPNFLCVEVTRRYFDRTGQDNWTKIDTITSKLSYFDHQEKYEIVDASNHPDNTPLSRLGGMTSRGEFGSQMREIFLPAEHAQFEWERWGKVRGKSQYVFAYRIEQEYSHYSMAYGEHSADELTCVPGYHGLVFIDEDNGMITRLTLDPDIPPTFPVKMAHTVLDYDFAQIGDNTYLVPLAARITSKDDHNIMTRNDKEFRLYRKFGTEATITFAPEPIPEDKLKEESTTPEKPH